MVVFCLRTVQPAGKNAVLGEAKNMMFHGVTDIFFSVGVDIQF